LIPVADFTQGHIVLRGEHPNDKGQYRHQTLASIFGLGASENDEAQG